MKAKPIGKGMVLTDRDALVVREVHAFQLLTRDQLVRLGHFGSKTRANATLLRLVRFGYLARRYQPSVAGTRRALYFVGPQAGSLLPGPTLTADRRRVAQLSDLFIAHQLLVSDVRLAFHSPVVGYRLTRWMSDIDLRPLALGLVPDGYVEYELQGRTFGAFVEVDRGTETLGRWVAKVNAYLALAASGRSRTLLARQFFRVLVVAPSGARLTNLRRATATRTDRMFWFTSPDQLSAGPFAQVWWRPVETSRHSLLES